jgi:hypothetical protein
MQMPQRTEKELIMTAGDAKSVPGKPRHIEEGEVREPQQAGSGNRPIPDDMPREKAVSPHRYGRKEIEENIRPDPDPDDPVSP